MNGSILALIALLAVAAWPAQAGAQSIYKYAYPDGRVVYANKPVPGAKLLEEIEPPPPPNPANAARQKKDNAASRNDLGQAADRRAQSLDQAWEDLKHWTRRLEEAKSSLEAGREPREGERTGTAGGKARMNDGYWRRQSQNELAVEEAEARVRQAQDAINALR
ncbi:MAG TPA: DUF4124 domain-containing protein [Burkholderiales bacterium]|nr:DUF4124 domain-containing protein [Burkholderiales bacterium]